jgi:hypothetical protein
MRGKWGGAFRGEAVGWRLRSDAQSRASPRESSPLSRASGEGLGVRALGAVLAGFH